MKRIFTTLFALLIVGFLNAQIPLFSLEPRLGINRSSLDISSVEEMKKGTGWDAGLSVTLGRKHFIEGGLYYVYYKTTQTIQDEVTYEVYEDDLGYYATQFQLYYGIRFLDLKVAKLRFHMGPTYDVIGNIKDNDFNFTASDFEDDTWGFTLGLGAKVTFLTVFFDYNFGLSPVLLESDAKQGVFTLHFGLALL